MHLEALTESLFLYCPTCARDSLAEAPPCPDGHGAGCPDRACVDCGTALVYDVPLSQLRRLPRLPRVGVTARPAA